MDNEVMELIDTLYSMVSEAWGVPLGNDKCIVERDKVLSMIEEKTDQILQSIALATGKNKSVVMRMIDSLARKGLARRTVNPDDRRENLLSITAEGEKVVARFRAIDRRLTEELFDGIPAEKITHFFEVVDELSRRAGSR